MVPPNVRALPVEQVSLGVKDAGRGLPMSVLTTALFIRDDVYRVWKDFFLIFFPNLLIILMHENN
jgi:hypothetical protein